MTGDLAVPPGNVTGKKKKKKRNALVEKREGDYLSAFFMGRLYFALI